MESFKTTIVLKAGSTSFEKLSPHNTSCFEIYSKATKPSSRPKPLSTVPHITTQHFLHVAVKSSLQKFPFSPNEMEIPEEMERRNAGGVSSVTLLKYALIFVILNLTIVV